MDGNRVFRVARALDKWLASAPCGKMTLHPDSVLKLVDDLGMEAALTLFPRVTVLSPVKESRFNNSKVKAQYNQGSCRYKRSICINHFCTQRTNLNLCSCPPCREDGL